jgi:hypothetical protein
MGSSEILYERIPIINRRLQFLLISTSTIKTLVSPTDKDGWIISGKGEIQRIPNKDIVGIRPYKSYYLFQPKRLTGYQVQIKDRRLALIYTGGNRGNHDILAALKKCIGIKWDEIYRNEILLNAQALRLQ